MNAKYYTLLLILPLLTVALTTTPIDADAAKSKGVGTASYGSKNAFKVCGDRLCSETGTEKSLSQPKTVT
ncbi:MAG: hypothetical protein QXE84_05555, partial [Candidatus Nitrosotenuis sp.]